MSFSPLILGVSRQHDVSAALFRGGVILGVVEAERVVEVKHARGPEMVAPAAEALLAQHGLTSTDIDIIAIADTERDSFEHRFPETLSQAHGSTPSVELGNASALERSGGGLIGLAVRPDTRAHYSCHHASHAASAVFQSGFERCAVLIADGYGVCGGTLAYHYRDGQLERLDQYRDTALLGWRYQLFGYLTREIDSAKTDLLDLSGKVMGLNAYGTPKPALVAYFRDWFRRDFEDYRTIWDRGRNWFSDILPEPLTDDSSSVADQSYLDVIASMQEAFSQTLEGLAKQLLEETGETKIVVAGGCGLNVLSNTRIAAIAEEAFFQPMAGDGGIALGAAVAASSYVSGVPLHHPAPSLAPRRSPYLGLPLSDASDFKPNEEDPRYKVRQLLETDPATSQVIASALAAGSIVGIARDRSEIGPRALGNRSILASGADPEMRKKLNNNIKNREWWRPFAPVCRASDAERFFDFTKNALSPYMLTFVRAKPEYRERFVSACHEDGTARLQIVPDREWNPLLWDCLTEFAEQTGIGVLINTSFNVGGKPILNRGQTAFDLMMDTDMNAVWIDGCWIEKVASPGEI